MPSDQPRPDDLPRAANPAEVMGAAIASFDGTIAVAQALVASGRRIDLSGLEQEAAALVAALMALDAEEARRLRPALEALRDHVDTLAARLHAA
jgi:hypothetical protein